MTSALLENPPAVFAAPADMSVRLGGVAAPAAGSHGDVIAVAKHEWLQACAEGASSTRVLRLYEHYRDLVIARVAAVVADRPAQAS